MFTSVYDADGVEYQIKTGWDDCDSYRLGDPVKWSIEKDHPGDGTLLDGVHRGCGYPGGDAFVVIKDHRIAAIVPVEPIDPDRDYLWSDPRSQYSRLMAEWQPVEYERSWWTEEAWAAKAVADAKRRAEMDALREKSMCRLNHKHTAVCILKQIYPHESLKKLVYQNASALGKGRR
jgi:hypothetical protein